MKITKLAARAQKGDRAAWDELYRQTEKEAYFVALKVCGNPQDAEDLAHDAFLTALERQEQLEQPEKFRSWLNMIVANKCRDYLKKKKPMLFSELEQDGEDKGLDIDWEDDRETFRPEQTLDHKETVRLVGEIIEGLPEDQKLCILMYYREELSVAEIAQSLQVSEGTVKSRLNYARQKVKKRVEELERQGTKLYGMAPLPFLVWLLDGEAAALQLPETLLSTAVGVETSRAATAGNVATSAKAAAGTAATDVGAKAMLAGTVAKVAAGVAAVAIAVSGITGYIQHTGNEVEAPPASSETMQPEVLKQAALTAYEEMLSTGVTANGLEIIYYTYLDLDNDEVPELLVADNDGTSDSWTLAELYCYRDSSVTFCGHSDSRYEPFYLVNGDKVLGQTRMGHRYISLEGILGTTIYYWNEDETCNDPAVYRYSGPSHDTYEYEYITKDQFEYYNHMPDEVEMPGEDSFIETVEPITLQENPYGYISLETPAVVVRLPAGWREKFAYELGKESTSHVISVYEKDSYEFGGGHLFSILRYEPGEDYSYLPSYQPLGTWTTEAGATYEFVMSFPTDVQFMPEQQENYQALSEDIPWIKEHLGWKTHNGY